MESTTTAPAHTPTPWFPDVVMSDPIWPDGDLVHTAQITTRGDKDGWCTKVATATGETVAECRANAAFIVRACNSHGELLAAGEAAAKILGDIVTDNESDHGETAVLDRLSAAIAEAKGC